MVYGDWLAATDSSLSRHPVSGEKQELLNVNYDIRHFVPPEDWACPKNQSYSVALRQQRIAAEGVYSPNTGVLCMIGCRDRNGLTDCQILVTVQLASMDSKSREHGKGAISSLRDNADGLFFEKIDIFVYGMYREELPEAITRMDLESVMAVVSTALSCVFTALQILHTKRRPEAPPATSITMLIVLVLGHVARLVFNSEALLMSRRKQYFLSGNGAIELSEVMLRVPALIALVLQLRLLQLAWSGRRSAAYRSKAELLSAAERKALLRVCLPLYLLGGVLAEIAHAVNVWSVSESTLAVRVAPALVTLWEDLVAYAGLVQDGFLLPQILLNAFSGSGVRALSPWFYAGGTVLRAMPHAYDVVRAKNYVPSLRPSYVYASPRDDLFGVAWDVIIPCGAAALAALLFLQQWLGGRAGAALLRPRMKRSGEYEMVSSI